MIKVLVLLHITAGCGALIGMVGALVTSKGGRKHRRMGKIYSVAMAIALTLALLGSALTLNLFLFLIGLFSAYFVYTGWRLTQTKQGIRNQTDQFASQSMIVCGVAMIAYGIYLALASQSLGIALAVFGVIALLPAWQDYRKDQWPTGKERIVLHLNRMGGASIATITAAFVVNVQTNPAFIAWLLPAIIGGPIIFYWTRRTMTQSV